MSKSKSKNSGKIKLLSFDSENRNCMIVDFEDGFRTYIVVPPGKNRIDLITNHKISNSYYFDFGGIVIVTKETERIVYMDGLEHCTQKL